MKTISKVLSSYWCFLPLSICVVLCWALNVPLVSITILSLFFIASMAFCEDFRAAILPIFLLPYVFTTQNLDYYYSKMVYLIVLLVLLVLSVGYFIYRQIFVFKRKFEKGYLFWGLVAISIANVLAGAFSSQFDIKISLLTLVVCLVLFAVYLICKNFLIGDLKKHLCYAFLVACGVVMLEMLISGFMTGDLINAIANKKLRVGIDEINAAATLLGAGIPICLYLAHESTRKYLWYLVATVIFIFVIMSCSRGALLFTFIVSIAALIYHIIKCKNRKPAMYYSIGLVATLLLIFIVFHQSIIELFSWYIKRGFDDSGRFEIYEMCFDLFVKNPVFGVGYVTEYVVVPGTNLLITHSTIIQIFSSLGVVGLITYGLYYYQRYATLLKGKDTFSIFVMFSLLVAELYGLIDSFCMNIFLIMVFYIFSAECEKSHVKKQEQTKALLEDDVKQDE